MSSVLDAKAGFTLSVNKSMSRPQRIFGGINHDYTCFESNIKVSQSCGLTEHNIPVMEPNVNIHGAFGQTALNLNQNPSENSITKNIQQSPLVGKESGNVSVSPQVGEVSALNRHNQSGMENNGDSGQNNESK